MSIKLIGSVCVMIACGGYGFYMACQQVSKIRQLENLIKAIHQMKCELQFHHTSLPQLCRSCVKYIDGDVFRVFSLLEKELEDQVVPNACQCMRVVVEKVGLTDTAIGLILQDLGNNLGTFDLDGQLLSLERIQERCEHDLEHLLKEKASRIRSYQTLGLCAGAAIVILLV